MRRFQRLASPLVAVIAIVPAAVFAQAVAAPRKAAAGAATVTPVPRDGPWMERHERINAQAKPGEIDLVFVGDSITQGWESVGKGVWEKFYASRRPLNAGISGDRTQHVLWRLDHGNVAGIAPKVAVVMIGTNNAAANEPADTAAGIEAIVARLRDKLPATKILLLGVFPRDGTPDGPLRVKNAAVNELIARLDDGEHVFFLDIGPKFLAADGRLEKAIMPDLLHLSPRGYEIWAESIEPKLAELLGAK